MQLPKLGRVASLVDRRNSSVVSVAPSTASSDPKVDDAIAAAKARIAAKAKIKAQEERPAKLKIEVN